MGRLFGTDGVRGIANKDLTNELALSIGKAAAKVLAGELGRKPTVLIGKDTRASGDMLEAALTAGLCAVGANVLSVGVVPTPAVAYLIGRYGCDSRRDDLPLHTTLANTTALRSSSPPATSWMTP